MDNVFIFIESLKFKENSQNFLVKGWSSVSHSVKISFWYLCHINVLKHL